MANITDEQLDEINARRKTKGKPPLTRKQADALAEADGDDLDSTILLTAVFPPPFEGQPDQAVDLPMATPKVDEAYVDRRGTSSGSE